MMKFFLFLSLLFVVCFCKPKQHGKQDLSDVEHHEDDDDLHDTKYDHEAFLGKDESKEFDELTPEESKKRLAGIVTKIDSNNDGKVTPEELKAWIKHISQKYMLEDRDKEWKDLEHTEDLLTFEYYKNKTHQDADDKETIKAIEKDRRRWDAADEDHDGKLSKDEFLAFTHPEEIPRMRDVVIQETLDQIDKNNDGKISLEEYLNDMWKPESSDDKEPEWLADERKSFSEHRDKDKDGFLNHQEVGEWVMPLDHDYVESETTHLMTEADANKDGYLTKEEILEKHSVFAGSQATDYGEILKDHDEL